MKEAVIVSSVVAAIILLTSVVLGITQANEGRMFSNCKTPWGRIEYVFPSYRLGCWLGSAPGDKE